MNNNLENINDDERYKFIKGDICDNSKFKNTLIEFTPDWIINFAAESHVDRSINSPMNFIRTNVVGTANVKHIKFL